MRQLEKDLQEKMMLEILKSEKLRITILAAAFFIISLVFFGFAHLNSNQLSDSFFREYKGLKLYQWMSIMLLVSCLYQIGVYIRYKHVTDRLKKRLDIMRHMTVLVETSIPTGVLVIMAQIMEPTSFITTPFVYIYFLFIILSALRLDFKLCVFTGFVAASEYLWLYKTYIVGGNYVDVDPFLFAMGNHVAKAMLFLLMGMVTGFVTIEIKRRTVNTLKAAEEKNELNRQMLKASEEYGKKLEIDVADRTRNLNEKNRELNATLEKVEEANRKIMDSIQYSKMIQSSLLPNWKNLKQQLPDSFVIWRPRDIVGGDLVVLEFFEHQFLAGVIDCTGHGVPGAMMTMVASTGLRRITTTEGYLDPAEILRRLNIVVKKSLQQDTEFTRSNDGLDAAFCLVSPEENFMKYAGARLPLLIADDGNLRRIKGDRQSLGYKSSDLDFDFTSHRIDIKDEMSFYMHSDGIVDQLGGEKRLSFGKKRLEKALNENAKKPFTEQKRILLERFEAYKGDNEIQDDLTVLGFKVS